MVTQIADNGREKHRISLRCKECGKMDSIIDPRVVDFRQDYFVCSHCGALCKISELFSEEQC